MFSYFRLEKDIVTLFRFETIVAILLLNYLFAKGSVIITLLISWLSLTSDQSKAVGNCKQSVIRSHAIPILILYGSFVSVDQRPVHNSRTLRQSRLSRMSRRNTLRPFAYHSRSMTLQRTDQGRNCFIFGVLLGR